MNKKNRIILLAAMIVAAVSQTFAQGNGLAGINEATSMVTSYFDPGTKLIYAIGAVVGLIGGIKVYGKFSSGDRSVALMRTTMLSTSVLTTHLPTVCSDCRLLLMVRL